MKVATYSRISTDEDRQPFSLGAQKDRLEAYIAVQDGWTLARSYTDQVSGKTLDRPGLSQALTDAREKRYELLLVFKVDRLARSTSGLVQVLEGLDAAGVAFRSVSEPFDTSTAAGRMMIQMLGVFAEFEREMIVERTKMGLAKKASKGEWTGGKPPYGYSYDIDQKLLIPVDKEAALIARSSIGTPLANGARHASAGGSMKERGRRGAGTRGRQRPSLMFSEIQPTLASCHSTVMFSMPHMSQSSSPISFNELRSCSRFVARKCRLGQRTRRPTY